VRRALLALVLVLSLAGCGGGGDAATTTDTGTATAPVETTDVRVYWFYDGKVWPALREVEQTQAVATAALEELLAGPTDEEEVQFSFSSAIPEGVDLRSVTVENGVARVDLSGDLPERALAQVVYTASQFPTVDSVEVGGESYTRNDFEDLTPAILVESPLYFEEVGNPVRATGSANTFEATFQYELTDTDGRVVDDGFVTATSGSGTRGTFDFTTSTYEIPFDGVGALVVYELSAKDGSRTNLREIPVRMSK
jgi:germination protein M